MMTLRADQLPNMFRIESSYHLPITGMVLHRGSTIRIRICDDYFELRPTQRVRIVGMP